MFLSAQQPWAEGNLGHYLTAYILQYFAEKNATISALLSPPFLPQRTKASTLRLGPSRQAKLFSELNVADDCDALQQFFNHQHLDTLLIPSKILRPDGILPLVANNKHAGFMVYQVQHHNRAVSWKKFLEEVLPILQPFNFCSGAASKFEKWTQLYNQAQLHHRQGSDFVWIRVSL